MSVMRLRLFGPMRLELPTAAQAAVRVSTSGPAVQARTPPRADATAGTTPVPWQRPAALLAWLGCADDWVPREQLATWLRPDADPDTARAYLRRLLHRVRALYPAADAALQVEVLRVRWAGACDVREFRAACAAQDWEQALALHTQPLLADAPALGEAAIDDWLEDERLALRRRCRAALGAALQTRGDAGDTAGVLALMQRLVDDDPLDEEGVQWVLARAALPGADEAQRRVALQAFDALQRRLALEMALKPLPATDALADALRRRRDAALQAALRLAQAFAGALAQTPSSTPHPHAGTSAAAHGPAPTALASAPSDAGPLLGRAGDLAQLRRLLTRPGARWITVLGPGGMGKTRLAAALARAECGRWRDGAWWIALAAVDSATGLHDRLAEALGLPPGEGHTGQRLAAALAEREAPLVLDNVEQLQPEALALQALVDAAPAVQWLATSREALGLPAEHRLVLEGLTTEGDQAPAQALLAQHAARHAAPLDLADPATAEAARRLLHAVRGLPPAIVRCCASIDPGGASSQVRGGTRQGPAQCTHRTTPPLCRSPP
jgi:DNA-binding SARP family transcriptional activator